MRILVVITLPLVLAAARPLAAQFPPEVAARTRVRVVLPDSVRQAWGPPREQWLRGEVASLAVDTLYLRLQGAAAPVPIPRAAIRRIDRSLGVPSRPESALRGAVSWAFLGALYWAALHADVDDTSRALADRLGEGAAIGAGVGFVLGAIFPSERWRRVHLRR
jgi:hypothetical protein